MKIIRLNSANLLRAAIAATLGTCAAPLALAQDQAATPPPDDEVSEVVVTGTRVATRTRLDSLAPIDVLPAAVLEKQGSTELAEALSTVAPSLDFPRPSITDGTDHIRPATLRGLAPDQTLVLVNSKRRHQSALVNVNGSVGRGSAAVDLNAIPLAAIESVEVLRDGASAQYGSDAIAGVINLRLRDAREGGDASITYGAVRHRGGDRTRHSAMPIDGATMTASGWVGLPLGEEGFLTLSAEYRDRDPTSRGDFDNRVPGSPVTSRYGDSRRARHHRLRQRRHSARRRLEHLRLGRLSESRRRFRRVPAHLQRCAQRAGYLPERLPAADHHRHRRRRAWAGACAASSATGTRTSAWSYGLNDVRLRRRGQPQHVLWRGLADQLRCRLAWNTTSCVFNAGVVRGFEVGNLPEPLNLALGVEARRENYGIEAGEPASYELRTGRRRTGRCAGLPGLPARQ